MGIRKILAYDIRMKKNPQTKEDTFWIFTDFHEVSGSKVQLALPHGSFTSGVTNPEIVYMLLRFQILCIDCFFLFKYLLWQKIYYILVELTWVGSNQWLPQQEVLEESIKIFIYQTEQTYKHGSSVLLKLF